MTKHYLKLLAAVILAVSFLVARGTDGGGTDTDAATVGGNDASAEIGALGGTGYSRYPA